MYARVFVHSVILDIAQNNGRQHNLKEIPTAEIPKYYRDFGTGTTGAAAQACALFLVLARTLFCAYARYFSLTPLLSLSLMHTLDASLNLSLALALVLSLALSRSLYLSATTAITGKICR